MSGRPKGRQIYVKLGTHAASYVRLISRGKVEVGAKIVFRENEPGAKNEEGIVREVRDVGGQPLHFIERW